MEKDIAVFIGRFQPFHQGHLAVVQEALEKVGRVLILIGSSFEPRSLRNPWSYDERVEMIRSCFGERENSRITCEPLIDIRYNDTVWASEVQRVVYSYEEDDSHIFLVGRSRSGEGYYTNRFPQWGHIPVSHDYSMTGTHLRHRLFGDGDPAQIVSDVPSSVSVFLDRFLSSDGGKNLCTEHIFVEKYKKGWEAAPFAPTHVTVDAVVVQSAHVLLIKRGAQPGKGLFALPGGFIHSEESLLNAMLRKLKEETQIKVPIPALIGSIKNQTVFDAPFRSDRGRTITHAFYIELRGEDALPKIKGGGESENCFWLPLGKLESTMMFEDHYSIIQKMIGWI